MGRPPCCDQVGIKKGPWTPEEDIILVSYIQEHGPGNWRSVPTNTGLMRCSKSCRLRWTNYLRPGIKRGNFTPHEEGMIIHLQALLGNKWAAIASYLSQRTDNDIKNYWNTHLKKKLKKFQAASSDQTNASAHHRDQFPMRSCGALSSDQRRDLVAAGDVTSSSSSSSAIYASSTENISRLLEGWMRSSPKNNTNGALSTTNNNGDIHNNNNSNLKHQELEKETTSINCCYHPKVEQEEVKDSSSWGLITHEEFESILSFENSLSGTSNISWDKSSSTTGNQKGKQKTDHPQHQQPPHPPPPPPLSILEKWLFDETTNGGQVEEIMEL